MSKAIERLEQLANELERLNDRLEKENRRIRAAILALADAMDELLASIDAEPEIIERARLANDAARAAVNN